MTSTTLTRSTRAALAVAASLAAAACGAANAQDAKKPAPKADEPVKPVAPAPATDQDAAVRALTEEVAKLREQIEEMRKAQAAAAAKPAPAPAAAPVPAPTLVVPVDPNDPVAVAARAEAAAKAAETKTAAPAAAAPQPTVIERETFIEREEPVYYEGDECIPVYAHHTYEPAVYEVTVGCDPWYAAPVPCAYSWTSCGWRFSVGCAPRVATTCFGGGRSFGAVRCAPTWTSRVRSTSFRSAPQFRSFGTTFRGSTRFSTSGRGFTTRHFSSGGSARGRQFGR